MKKNAIELLKDLRVKYQNDKSILNSLSEWRLRLYPEQSSCLICGKKTLLLKTDWKTCYSFELGKFTLISGSNFCHNHKYFSKKPNRIIKYESALAALIVDNGYSVAFDLVVKVGRLRFDDNRQLEEIHGYLKCSRANIDLPISTIGMIAKRFLIFCQLLHEKFERQINDDIKMSGGYILHFDGSTEQKCGKCNLLILDSLSGHVLESDMINSEKSDTVKKALNKVYKKYGSPLAVISDLKPGFLKICIEIFGKDVIHILCHYHFLRTFRDEFTQKHLLIRNCLTQKWQLNQRIKAQLTHRSQL